jgi:hypothetical protein
LPLRGFEESPGEAVTAAELAAVEPPAVLLVLNVVGTVGVVAAADEATGADVPEPAPGKHCE